MSGGAEAVGGGRKAAAESSLTPQTEGHAPAVSRHADAMDGAAFNRHDGDFLLFLMELTRVYLGAFSAEALNGRRHSASAGTCSFPGVQQRCRLRAGKVWL